MEKRTVMVAEDYDDTRMMIRVMLEMRGYRVIEAADGLAAVELAEREHPDLILMDLDMPVLDGCAAAIKIRELESLRDVPIVAVTAHLKEDWQARASRAGFADYVAKPMDLTLLDRVLARHLPQA